MFVWRVWCACCCEDSGEAALEVVKDAVVRKAEDVQAASGEDAVALGVVVGLSNVNAAVKFDNEPCGVAIEIRDEAVDDLLAAKVEAAKATGAKMVPEPRFGGRHRLA